MERVRVSHLSCVGVAIIFGWTAMALGEKRPEPTIPKAGEVKPLQPRNPEGVPIMVIPAGPHYLTTSAGSSTAPVKLPADFFFEGSLPVDQLVPMHGDAVAAKPTRKDGFHWIFARLVESGGTGGQGANDPTKPYDTVMVQYQNAVLPRIGSQATVDIKLTDVRLVSVEPLTVTGTQTKSYHVTLEVKPYHQESARFERMGTMTLTRNGLATGEFTSTVHGWARLVFTPVDGGEALIFDHDQLSTMTTSVPTPFLVPRILSENGVVAAPNQISVICCGLCHLCDWGGDDGCGCGLHCP